MAIFRKFIAAIKKRLIRKRKIRRIKKPKKKISPHRKKSSIKRRQSYKSSSFPRSTKKLKSQRTRRKNLPRSRPHPKENKLKISNQNPPIGEVTHFFSRIGVCVIKITRGEIHVGDQIEIKGHTTHFTQKVQSLQIENSEVKTARPGQLVGLKINKKARTNDRVYKVVKN